MDARSTGDGWECYICSAALHEQEGFGEYFSFWDCTDCGCMNKIYTDDKEEENDDDDDDDDDGYEIVDNYTSVNSTGRGCGCLGCFNSFLSIVKWIIIIVIIIMLLPFVLPIIRDLFP